MPRVADVAGCGWWFACLRSLSTHTVFIYCPRQRSLVYMNNGSLLVWDKGLLIMFTIYPCYLIQDPHLIYFIFCTKHNGFQKTLHRLFNKNIYHKIDVEMCTRYNPNNWPHLPRSLYFETNTPIPVSMNSIYVF